MSEVEYHMDLRISHYLEDESIPGRVGAIVCFYRDGLIKVRPGSMNFNERETEWRFGNDLRNERVYCTVRYGCGHVHFDRFRPDLNLPRQGDVYQ